LFIPKTVIPGLVPGTHDLPAAWVFMGSRDKPGYDGKEVKIDSA
jgi:hypothetical protein